jgi:hypothetical protein
MAKKKKKAKTLQNPHDYSFIVTQEQMENFERNVEELDDWVRQNQPKDIMEYRIYRTPEPIKK